MASSSISDIRPVQTVFDLLNFIEWCHGHSYAIIDHEVRFICRKCCKEMLNWECKHCWDCMSKYCEKCYDYHDYYCPRDGHTGLPT